MNPRDSSDGFDRPVTSRPAGDPHESSNFVGTLAGSRPPFDIIGRLRCKRPLMLGGSSDGTSRQLGGCVASDAGEK